MAYEENLDIFVKNSNGEKAFKLIRVDGELTIDVKTKIRDKNVPANIRVEAIEVIDQIAAAMSYEERMKAYAKLLERLPVTN